MRSIPVTFQQTVEFADVTARDLYRTYMNSQEHAAAINAPASIDPEIGGAFKIFGDDGLSGRNLALIPDKLIVQAWRGQAWKPRDADSTLILMFEDVHSGACIHLAHLNVPGHAYRMVNADAWTERYWRPWKDYFSSKQGSAKARRS
jgi:activator of HSP90 ATPase